MMPESSQRNTRALFSDVSFLHHTFAPLPQHLEIFSINTTVPAKAGTVVGHRGRVRQHTPTLRARHDEPGQNAQPLPNDQPTRQRALPAFSRSPAAAARQSRKAEPWGFGGDYLPQMPFRGPGRRPASLRPVPFLFPAFSDASTHRAGPPPSLPFLARTSLRPVPCRPFSRRAAFLRPGLSPPRDAKAPPERGASAARRESGLLGVTG